MRQLFTCLPVSFFVADLPRTLVSNIRQEFSHGISPADYLPHFAEQASRSLLRYASDSEIIRVSALPNRFHLPDPIA